MNATTSRLVLIAALLAATAIYWKGLSGPFLFDDRVNLFVIQQWLDGQTSWFGAVAGYHDWLTARPVSMASFTLTAWLGDGTSYSYKLGNLVLHLVCGLLAWSLFRTLLQLDRPRSPAPTWMATIAVTFWLLHPLHVSTVLYAVQRMAQLSTCFVLLSLLAYTHARISLDAGRTTKGTALLFLVFPTLLLIGLLSKQNAAVAPAMCLVIELAFFQSKLARPARVSWFFGAFLALPILGLVVLLAIAPQHLLSGYADWDFTLKERLLSQPRALMDYLGMLLAPRTPRMGLYTDDFATSTSLFSPPTTIFSILALGAICAGAVFVRKRAAGVFAGWFFFLVAHGVESSFLPVEMYYEHRNYLPSLGIFLALVSGVDAAARLPALHTFNSRKLGGIFAVCFAFVLAFATFGRVQIWRSMDTIAEQALLGRPHSLRAAQTKALIISGKGRFDEGIQTLRPFATGENPRNRLLAGIDTLTIRCFRGDHLAPHELNQLLVDGQPKITVGEVLSLRELLRVASERECGGLSGAVIADGARALIGTAKTQPETAPPKAQLRMVAAVGYARSLRNSEAKDQAAIAWNGTKDPFVGDLLIRLYLQNDDVKNAITVYRELDQQIRPGDSLGQSQLRALQSLIALRAPHRDSQSNEGNPLILR